MADPAFPTRQYPYRAPDPTAGPDPAAAVALVPGTVYRFVLGVDPAPRPLTADELAALEDPFGAALLRRGVFPQTTRELLAALNALGAQGLPVQESYVLGDGGQIPWTRATAAVARQLRVVVSRRATLGAQPDVLASTSTALDSPQTFLQVVGWDEVAGAFRFYERRGGTWIVAGTSWDALAAPSRGRGPFDSHVNGALVMKELKVPWSHWHSQSASITAAALAPDDPFPTDPVWTARKGAETFERAVATPGVFRWTRSRLDRVVGPDGTVERLPELMRQVLTTTTVNLVSAAAESATVAGLDRLPLPSTFFLDVDAFTDRLGLDPPANALTVAGPAYDAARTSLELHLDDGAGFRRPGETFFAFLVPERALEDQMVLAQLIDREVLSVRLATCLLLVDVANPVWSDRRAALLAHVPDTVAAGDGGAELDEVLGAALEAAATTPDGPESEFLGWWTGSEEPDFGVRAQARLTELLDAWQKRLDDPDGALDLLRLAQGRRRRFRDSHLAEFALTVARSPIDDEARALRVNPDASLS